MCTIGGGGGVISTLPALGWFVSKIGLAILALNYLQKIYRN